MRAWAVLWLLAIGLCLVMILALSGCASPHASRNMMDMTADELRHELARPL